jgi:hypothetical protein
MARRAGVVQLASGMVTHDHTHQCLPRAKFIVTP